MPRSKDALGIEVISETTKHHPAEKVRSFSEGVLRRDSWKGKGVLMSSVGGDESPSGVPFLGYQFPCLELKVERSSMVGENTSPSVYGVHDTNSAKRQGKQNPILGLTNRIA